MYYNYIYQFYMIFVFFISSVLNGSEKDKEFILFIYYLSALIGMSFWVYIIKKFESYKCLIIDNYKANIEENLLYSILNHSKQMNIFTLKIKFI